MSINFGVGFDDVAHVLNPEDPKKRFPLGKLPHDVLITMSTADCGEMSKWDVIRRKQNAEPLVAYADRLDMGDFVIYCRTFDLCDWAQQAFPTAQICFANPLWYLDANLYDSSDYSSDEDSDSEYDDDDDDDDD